MEGYGDMKNPTNGRYVASISPPPNNPYLGWGPCIHWCMENLYHGGHYEPKWHYLSEGVFEFEDEQEYLAFLLKWA